MVFELVQLNCLLRLQRLYLRRYGTQVSFQRFDLRFRLVLRKLDRGGISSELVRFEVRHRRSEILLIVFRSVDLGVYAEDLRIVGVGDGIEALYDVVEAVLRRNDAAFVLRERRMERVYGRLGKAGRRRGTLYRFLREGSEVA